MTQIPSKDAILQWITDNPTQTGKRDIARAFGIKGADRIDLKRVLRELEAEGKLAKRGKTYRDAETLPPVAVLSVIGPDRDGDLFAKPLEWHGEGDEPRILLTPRAEDPALGAGDRVLARLTVEDGEDHSHSGRVIRKLSSGPRRVLGIFRKGHEGGRILPVDKGSNKEWSVAPGATHGARDGELVEAEQAGPRGRLGLPQARIVARLGDPTAPKAVSLIAIHEHGIPNDFAPETLAEADSMKPAGLKGREDLRPLPLVTIDPWDARDHDDAVYAKADSAADNPGGFVLWVAIADVAHYVRPDTALDREARERGNSTYFPDRVVPMLPDRLSGDLCSLHEEVPRACLAAKMRVSAEGELLGHSFHRGLMESRASLTYEQVQKAADGTTDDATAPLMDTIITPLYGCYSALRRARERRQPLELDLPEREIVLGEDGKVLSVDTKERLDAHRMIEEFMVLANVAAAQTLEKKRQELLYRVHEEPNADKLDALRETARAAGFGMAKGQVLRPGDLNRLLAQAAGTEEAELINMSTLRAMTQAYYSPQNFGHFGLALRSYAHFTSPIRRYADLIVHRGLIAAHRWGDDGLTDAERADLEPTAKHISQTERRSMEAERDTKDRYLAAYLADRIGAEFTGRIAGVQPFGAFVRLDETGADGLIPIATMGDEYFHFDEEAQALVGGKSGRRVRLGDRVTVKLQEAVPVAGGLAFTLLRVNGDDMPQGRGAPRGKSGPKGRGARRGKPGGKSGPARNKSRRKVSRKR